MKAFLSFWKYNKEKFFYQSIMMLIIFLVIQYLTISYFVGSFIMDPRQLFDVVWSLYFLLLWVGYLLIYLIAGMNNFKTINRLCTDKSQKSIVPIFDNGVTKELLNEENKFLSTIECITGTISGLPVKIFVVSGKRNYLKLSCYALVRIDSEEQIERSTTFMLTLFNKLYVDVKPIISEFIAEIISEGYKSGIEISK